MSEEDKRSSEENWKRLRKQKLREALASIARSYGFPDKPIYYKGSIYQIGSRRIWIN